MKVAVIGCGRVGWAFAGALARRPGKVSLAGVHSREMDRARALIRWCGRGRAFAKVEEAAGAADVLLLCVSDAAIPTVASRLARGAVRGKVVLHTSGALGREPLASLARRGAIVGALHPLAAFPRAGSRGSRTIFSRPLGFAISGDAKAATISRGIVRALGGLAIDVPKGSRAAYHLAASLMANHVTVLALLALDLLRARARMRSPAVTKAFIALLRTVSDRLEEEPSLQALTGPAARGDLTTLRRHLRVLAHDRDALAETYRLLGGEAVRMSLRRGSLSPAAAVAALRLLASPRAR